MKRLAFVALVVLFGGCASSPSVPIAPTAPAPATTASIARAAAAPQAHAGAGIAFVQKGPNVLDWDFALAGFPALDVMTGTVVVADISHGHIASSLSLVIRWYRPGAGAAEQSFAVLAPEDASRVLYELEGNEAEAERAKLGERTRVNTDVANARVNLHELRGMPACKIAKYQGACTHPQRVTCGAVDLQLDGDRLGTTTLGWSVPPMDIGAGPPKQMLTCIEQAYYEPEWNVLVARIEHACKGGGSDACFLPYEWRATKLR